MKNSIALLIITFLCQNLQAELLVQIRAPQGDGDKSHHYYASLLEMALELTEGQHEEASVEVSNLNVTQGRALRLLKGSGRLDAEFAGTNSSREEMHHVARVPLTMGLLGTRMLVIHHDRAADFDKIKTPQQLKQFIACQGSHWPDSDILETNGYAVVRAPLFEQMWRMLEHGKCDYFPRSVIEGYGEVKHFGSDKFIAYDRILLSYRFPMYFFFADHQEKLAQRVEQGLDQLINDGKLQDFLSTHPVTSAAFPLDKYNDSLIFPLSNEDISNETASLDSKYWLALD